MARARNIKPGFFTNEELVELPFETRLLFIGLWTIADRAGRLEDRPKKIRMTLFPADNVDVEEMLSGLESSGFIVRYEIEYNKYIQILNFEKHQNPHKNEAESSIPAPYKYSTSTAQVPDKHDATHADSHDSLIPSNTTTDVVVVRNDESVPDCPHQEIINLYKKNCPEAIHPRTWDGSRAVNLKSRWRECKDRQSLDWWDKFFEYISESDFLMGRVQALNRTPFELRLDWIVNKSNFSKILDGTYQNRHPNQR